ncbi:hypothetical protein RND71_043263 [Anisodus tanguticus]|uniref:P-type ATPase n=1 Tax=Anisodus tanguticus TaxID=243964 RepID=A0AAE1QPA4_9SOLA|nr:hypothetical protein RND71_043263 [Anisodus tanguticus]
MESLETLVSVFESMDTDRTEGVAGLTSNESKKISSPSDLPLETTQVMATCHSLVQLDDDLVGDPLEKVTIKFIDWSLIKNDNVCPKKGKHPAIKIVQRFHFSSALKRMSVIANYINPTTNESQYIVTTKGAPETLKTMYKNFPENYDEIYLNLSRKGARVIALGRKNLGNISLQEAKDLKRDDVEKDLDFAGFLIISTPLKPDSKALIKEIIDSSHRVVMITGDAPLTACYVAKELNFMQRKRSLILSKEKDGDFEPEFKWRSIDRENILSIEPDNIKKFLKNYDLCLTGDAVTYLLDNNEKLFNKLLPFVKVWARVAPKQKEFIITSMRAQGYYVLMCGDGTNDVGALKHADAGIALIANAPLTVTKQPSVPKQSINKENLLGPRQQRGLNRKLQPMDAKSKMTEIRRIIDEMNEQDKAEIVKLGDASIAAPFTSKLSSIKCVCDIIKQGRCTLVTTLQMFKILALNALILAYCQSVLYLDGVRMSDSQATIQSLLLSGCFLFISRSNRKYSSLFCIDCDNSAFYTLRLKIKDLLDVLKIFILTSGAHLILRRGDTLDTPVEFVRHD